MKKFTFLSLIPVLFAFLFSQALFGQERSQRMVLLEQFTNASCGPCASENPTIVSLHNTNATKMALIFYHVNWPGASDPMYTANTSELGAMISYYGVKSVPYAALDGAGGAEVSQATINTNYAVASPYTITMTHAVSGGVITVNMTITKTAATTGTHVAKIAVIEEEMYFASAGNNGEKNFYNVFKKFLPNTTGTSLTLNVGESTTISQSWTYANVQDVANLGSVGFIVNTADKKIQQAAMSTLYTGPVIPVANFSASNTTTCTGVINFTDLSSGAPTSWLWNFGDGATSTQQNPSHTYATNGSYTVTLQATNTEGNDSEVKTSYITVNRPTGPTATNAQRCGAGTLDLSVSGSGSLDWYDAATNGNKVNTGTSYSPNLTSTTTFYVESNTLGTEQSVGMTAKTTDGTYYTSTARWAQVFDAITPLTIKTVKVYAGAAGSKTIWLANNSGTVIDSVTVSVPSGESVVTLNLDIPAGTGWQLGGQANCNLWRDASGATYPYTISNLISITGNTAGSTATSYCYYFYDWKVQAEGCISSRTPVTGTINAIPAKPTINVVGAELTSSANSGNQWYLNGNAINGATGKTYTCTENGAYKVKVTENNCSNESDPTDITVGIADLNSNNIFNVTPNPSFGIFTITVNSTEYVYNKLSIYNLLGKEIMSEVITNNNFKKVINLEGLTKGIYLVKISGANQTLFKKVVIE